MQDTELFSTAVIFGICRYIVLATASSPLIPMWVDFWKRTLLPINSSEVKQFLSK